MAWIDDFSVAANGDIRHVSGTTRYTVLEMHRALQDLADNAQASGDDLLDISVVTPSDRSTDNIISLIDHSGSGGPTYNIDDTAATFLYDGSVSQENGATIYAGLVVVGVVESGTQVIIIQNNALLTDTWSAFPNADAANNIILRALVKTRADGANIDGQRLIVQAREYGDTYAEFLVTMGLGNNTAALFTAPDLNNQTAFATVLASAIANDNEGYIGLDVDGNASNEFYYSNWDLNGEAINLLYEYGKAIQRRGTSSTLYGGVSGSLFRGITHQIDYDAEAGTGIAELIEVAWGLHFDYDAQTTNVAVGEAITFSGGAIGRILAVEDAGATGSLIVAIESGTAPIDNETFTTPSGGDGTVNGAPVGQATGGGAGRVLALNDTGTSGTLWIQLTKGTAPADNAIIYRASSQANSVTQNGAAVTRTVPSTMMGQSTGSAILGAYGLGIDPADLTASDQLRDLGNNVVTPPNNVTFTVTGLVSGEDRVLVGPEAGGLLDVDQFTIAATYTSAAQGTIQINTPIPSDTPTSGTIRVQDDDGVYRRLAYSSYAGDTFTLTSPEDFSTVNATSGNNCFISYIDVLASSTSASFTSVYLADRALFIRVRDGAATPIKTFETTGTLGSAGGSATAIRTSDA